MNRFGPAFVISVLLHVGLFMLAFISWQTAPKPPVTPSVPIELVSQVPAREQAQAPVDELAVKTPEPEPAPEEPVKPQPTPEPTPKLPVPTPQKPVAKPEPKPVEKKPDPKPAAKTPPDPKGVKKPAPAKPAKPALDLDALSQLGASPSKANTRKPAQANTRKTDGSSQRGTSPQDAGTQSALNDLGRRLGRAWNPNCDVPGGNQVKLEVIMRLSPNGRVIKVDWVNRRSDPIWQAAYSRARAAISQLEPYEELPKELYGVDIPVDFDAPSACRNQ